MPGLRSRCPCLRAEEPEVDTLDYRHSNLAFVPSDVFMYERTLRELYVDANQIKDLPRELFYCHGLRKLSLSDNELRSIPPAISSLVNLEELDISKNAVIDLPENLKSCKHISVIEASVNPLGKLPECFTQLLSLTQLYLNDTFLEYLPGSFGRLNNLKILEIRENRLDTLPKSMSRLTQLERLDIGNNDFSELPEVVGSMGNLLELWCDSNALSTLPAVLGQLKQLMFMDASKNRLKWIPPEIEGCVSLADLHLSTNLLEQLPESIGRLSTLTTLKLDDNRLTSLPFSIGGLVSLSEMHIGANDLETLPPSIGLLRHLRTLYADDNYLLELPPELGSCSGLTVLSLRSNCLTYIPDEIGRIRHLRVLNLSSNKLRFLPYSFTRLKELQALWLAANQTKPLIRLQSEVDRETGCRSLTCYLLPQHSAEDTREEGPSDVDSFHPSLWEEERLRKQQIQFDFGGLSEEEGRLQRTPTPYPKEMKQRIQHIRNMALKQQGPGGDSTSPRKSQQATCTDDRRVGKEAGEDASGVEIRIGEDGNTSSKSPMQSHHLLRADREKMQRDKCRLQQQKQEESLNSAAKSVHSHNKGSARCKPDDDDGGFLVSGQQRVRRDPSSPASTLRTASSHGHIPVGGSASLCTTNSVPNMHNLPQFTYEDFVKGLAERKGKSDLFDYPQPKSSKHRYYHHEHSKHRHHHKKSRGYESDTTYQGRDYYSDTGYRSRGCESEVGYRSEQDTARKGILKVKNNHSNHSRAPHYTTRKYYGYIHDGYVSDSGQLRSYHHPHPTANPYQPHSGENQMKKSHTVHGIKDTGYYGNAPFCPRTTIRNDEKYESYQYHPGRRKSESRMPTLEEATFFNSQSPHREKDTRLTSCQQRQANTDQNMVRDYSAQHSRNRQTTAANSNLHPSKGGMDSISVGPAVSNDVTGHMTSQNYDSGHTFSTENKTSYDVNQARPASQHSNRTSYDSLEHRTPSAQKNKPNSLDSPDSRKNISQNSCDSSNSRLLITQKKQRNGRETRQLGLSLDGGKGQTLLEDGEKSLIRSDRNREAITGSFDDSEWKNKLYQASVKLQKSPTDSMKRIQDCSPSHGGSCDALERQPLAPPYKPAPPYSPARSRQQTEVGQDAITSRNGETTVYSVTQEVQNTSPLQPADPPYNSSIAATPTHSSSSQTCLYPPNNSLLTKSPHTPRLNPPTSSCQNSPNRSLSEESSSGLRPGNRSQGSGPPSYDTPLRLTTYEKDVAVFKQMEPPSQVSSSTDSGYGHGHFSDRVSAHGARYSGTPPSPQDQSSPLASAQQVSAPYRSPCVKSSNDGRQSQDSTPQRSPHSPSNTSQVLRVQIIRDPGLGFSIAGGTDSPGNPFRSEDHGIFITKVYADGPAAKALKIGDKILEVNGVDFRQVEHGHAVDVLRSCGRNVPMVIERF